MSNESRRIWNIIKGSLPSWTRKDIEQWGGPLLCDLFSVLVPPVGLAGSLGGTNKDKPPKLQMFSYCVLFTTKLAFFLPRYHFHENPDNNSIFTLVGVIDVQRDINNPQLTTLSATHQFPDNIVKTANKLEFFATSGDTRSRTIEQRVWFVSVRTNWTVDDRTKDWETVMKALLRSPCEARIPGERRSFLLSPVQIYQ